MKAELKILAVDDNASIRESMRFIFAGPRFEVTSAEDGKEALSKLDGAAQVYDIIIVDEKMPNVTGLELVRGIRARQISGKIIVLSAHLTPETRQAYERMDVPTILDKPFDLHELRSAVEHLAA